MERSPADEGHALGHGLLIHALLEITQQLPHVLVIRESLHRILLSIFSAFKVEDAVDSEFKQVIKHAGNEHAQDSAALFNSRVCVDFDEPHLKGLIDHKIVPKQLEALPSSININPASCRAH